MLTNKEKIFLENIAKKLREKIGIAREPNIYNYGNLLNFIKDLKYDIVFGSSTNCTVNNVIYLKCSELNENSTNEEYVNFQKDLLYQIWKISKKKYAIYMLKFNEEDAGYFFRAMLMPKEAFTDEVDKNIGRDGICNIVNIAKKFHVEYTDASARIKDLGIFNKNSKY